MNEQLQQLLCDLLDLEPGDVHPGLARDEVDGWDSLNHLRLITAVEETFAVKFSMDEIESVDGIGRLRDLLEARRGL